MTGTEDLASKIPFNANKPAEYGATLQKLADRGIYAITSFIFGMEGDTASPSCPLDERGPSDSTEPKRDFSRQCPA